MAASISGDEVFEHGDPVSMICLLCQRQFKKIDELKKHNKLSALHKAHLWEPPRTRIQCSDLALTSLLLLAMLSLSLSRALSLIHSNDE